MSDFEKKSPPKTEDLEKNERQSSVGGRFRSSISVQHVSEDTIKEGQVYSMNDIDPALDAKLRLVNQVRFSMTYPKTDIETLPGSR